MASADNAMPNDYVVEIPGGVSFVSSDVCIEPPSGNMQDAIRISSVKNKRQHNPATTHPENESSNQPNIGLSRSASLNCTKQTSVEGPARVRWYFKKNEADGSPEESAFNCVPDYCPSVNVDASRRFTRLTRKMNDNKDVKGDIYNISLTLSIENLDLDCIESIAFSTGPGIPYHYGPLEILTRRELRMLFADHRNKVATLALHRQHVERSAYVEIFDLDIEVRTLTTPAGSNPGCLELHHMELSAFHPGRVSPEPSLKWHQPFLWSIDVGSKDNATNSTSLISTRIIHYAVSGNGRFISTLSARKEHSQLDLWDLELNAGAVPVTNLDSVAEDTDIFNERRSPFYPSMRAQYLIPLSRPVPPAMNIVPLMVSVSWDGSKVAMIAADKKYVQDTFQMFEYRDLQEPLKRSSTATPGSLTRLGSNQLWSGALEFCGSGKFHMTSSINHNPADELFVTCDGKAVIVYSVHDAWSKIRVIDVSNESLWIVHRDLIEGLRSKYFAWPHNNGAVSICDLETGQLVCCATPSSTASSTTIAFFSNDGSLVLFHEAGGIVTTRWTESGTVIGKTSGAYNYPAFISNNLRVIMPIVDLDQNYGRGLFGVTLDAFNLSVLDRISVPSRRFDHQHLSAGARGQYLYSMHGSKLDLIRLHDMVVPSYLQPRYRCDHICFDELKKLSAPDILSRQEPGRTALMSSGLRFRIEFRAVSAKERRNGSDLQAAVVWISGGQSREREALVIPPAEIGSIAGDWLEYKVFIDDTSRRMIVYTSLYVMIWSVPTIVDGDFTLISTWWVQTVPFQLPDRVDWCWTELALCTHQEAYLKVCNIDENYEDQVFDIVRLHCDDVFASEPLRFLDGLLVLIEMFDTSGDAFRQHILSYVGLYINNHADPAFCAETIMTRICHRVTQENHAMYAKFLKALLGSPKGRWVPRPHLDQESNPIWILLELAKAVPRAIDLAQIVIDYCIRMASTEKDQHFLLPVMDSLHELVAQQKLHTDVTHDTLRRLAFIPVMERGYIIDHAVIAHPPQFRLRFWEPNTTALHECKDPVFRLDRDPKFKTHDSQNDNFTRDIYATSFDLLWYSKGQTADTRSSLDRIKSPSQAPTSWGKTLLHVMLLQMKRKSSDVVICHKFDLSSLDNPAIAALVEYKWNTIGWIYWLVRFLWQCLYYLLVLVAVFLQVYSPGAQLTGLFLAIIVCSTIFLWLELLQSIPNPKRYISSPYNIVDLIVFGLPLIGSIFQVVNAGSPNAGDSIATLSFSVLFIFLHFVSLAVVQMLSALFELRINRSVCHFVTIIIRIIGEIRVFFVVFACGILAFTIAILHLLRACSFGTCEALEDVKFPSHFYRAFSATYFFMGGIWDPVSDNFDNDNWAFHTMMIIYFFFTTILLLNVLIALINVAFTAGDETWLLVWIENRLRYVEAAESMTHHIPGFREAHDWFPKEIYYSATLQEVKNYRTKYFNKNSEDSGRGDTTHRLFGQTSSAKKAVEANASSASASASVSSSLAAGARDGPGLEELIEQQQQIIQELKKELAATQEKRDKHSEDVQAQLAEVKQLLLEMRRATP
ncbi:hypothetical protein EDD11_010436 [Mortierella claussenii]|nr:hypothetical protein EDD11_010436 [Mortierella claussenii]